MNEKNWELPASAALDGELEPEETLELLDAMADDELCRTNWRRLREFDRRLDPLIQPAGRRLQTGHSRFRAVWWLAPAAAAAVLAFAWFATDRPVQGFPGPDGQSLTIRLQEHEGQMTESRFVELVVEVLQADQRYQAKMLEVLEEVRPQASLAEAGSPEVDPPEAERIVLGQDERTTTRTGELPYEAVAGIH